VSKAEATNTCVSNDSPADGQLCVKRHLMLLTTSKIAKVQTVAVQVHVLQIRYNSASLKQSIDSRNNLVDY